MSDRLKFKTAKSKPQKPELLDNYVYRWLLIGLLALILSLNLIFAVPHPGYDPSGLFL